MGDGARTHRADHRARRPAAYGRRAAAGHRPVRAGAVGGRVDPRAGHHRGRPVSGAGLFGRQHRQRGRRAPPVGAGPAGPDRIHALAPTRGHLRPAAQYRRGRGGSGPARMGYAAAHGHRHPGARRPGSAPAHGARHDLGAGGHRAAGARQPARAARRGIHCRASHLAHPARTEHRRAADRPAAGRARWRRGHRRLRRRLRDRGARARRGRRIRPARRERRGHAPRGGDDSPARQRLPAGLRDDADRRPALCAFPRTSFRPIGWPPGPGR